MFGTGSMWKRLTVLAALSLVAASCQFDPSNFAGTAMGDCQGLPATAGYGYDSNTDPTSGSTYEGTPGDDVVIITNGPVRFRGKGGNDTVCVLNGVAEQSNERVVVILGSGDDSVEITRGRGVAVYAQGGDNLLVGGPGDDLLSGSGTLTDREGDNRLIGGAGDDVITGSGTLRGGAGDDNMFGSHGDDIIDGGPGDDEISPYSGFDICTDDDALPLGCEVAGGLVGPAIANLVVAPVTDVAAHLSFDTDECTNVRVSQDGTGIERFAGPQYPAADQPGVNCHTSHAVVIDGTAGLLENLLLEVVNAAGDTATLAFRADFDLGPGAPDFGIELVGFSNADRGSLIQQFTFSGAPNADTYCLANAYEIYYPERPCQYELPVTEPTLRIEHSGEAINNQCFWAMSVTDGVRSNRTTRMCGLNAFSPLYVLYRLTDVAVTNAIPGSVPGTCDFTFEWSYPVDIEPTQWDAEFGSQGGPAIASVGGSSRSITVLDQPSENKKFTIRAVVPGDVNAHPFHIIFSGGC